MLKLIVAGGMVEVTTPDLVKKIQATGVPVRVYEQELPAKALEIANQDPFKTAIWRGPIAHDALGRLAFATWNGKPFGTWYGLDC